VKTLKNKLFIKKQKKSSPQVDFATCVNEAQSLLAFAPQGQSHHDSIFRTKSIYVIWPNSSSHLKFTGNALQNSCFQFEKPCNFHTGDKAVF
jgi:hypothetical protein